MAGKVAALVLGICAASSALGHTPVLNTKLDDWCLATAPRVEDRAATLNCLLGTEVVWWDAPADAAVNDLATLGTTQDATNLYWAIEMHVDPDPLLLPFIEVAIDVGVEGHDLWWDPNARIKAPGHCSVDTERLCTADEDCHFCAVTTIYTGTPNERPRACGSTTASDTCDEYDPTDICIRNQTCVGLDDSPRVPGVGSFSVPATAPDYLLVFDLSRFLLGLCDSVSLLRDDNGSWVEIPRAVPDPDCPFPTWRFPIPIPPIGTGDPGVLEMAVPWEAFDCIGCVPFGPDDDFRATAEVTRGNFTLDYIPDGPIEDVISEAVAGASTTTPDSCDTPGTATTLCEIADASTDAFVSMAPQAPGGRSGGLLLHRNTAGTPMPSITLTWNRSCSNADNGYAIYEGEIGSWYSHVGPASGAICDSGGATTATFDAGPGNHYYLVVPRDSSIEGSYGRDGDGMERPASATPCTAQSLGGCPGF